MEVVECIEYIVCLVLPTETGCLAGNAKLYSGMETHSVQTQITSTILMILYTSCVVVISILLEFIATMIMGVKIEGGDSDVAQLEVSESSTAV